MGQTYPAGSSDLNQMVTRSSVASRPEGRRSKTAGGVDEVQALLLAMQRAHTDPLAARENDGREVSWLDERTLGLPIAKAVWD